MTERRSERQAARRSPEVLYLAFTGASMLPALAPDDLLEVAPYGRKRIQPGDVIFFVDGADDSAVVHRVLSISGAGIRTRGDNNANADPMCVQPGNVVGRVVAARRGKSRRRIAGGAAGLMAAALNRVRRRAFRALVPMARAPVARLAGARSKLPALLKPRLVAFSSPSGEHWRLLVGRHVIATYRPQARAWQVRLPYRLLLNPASLPRPPSCGPASR